MNTIQQAHILLVDDNTDLLRLLEEQLRGAGYQNIRTVQNCAAAQTAFAAEMPELMILDINLPDGDGFSLFRTLRAKADVPTLFRELVAQFCESPQAETCEVSLQQTAAAEQAKLCVDRALLERLLENLLGNSIRHNSAPVEIEVQTDVAGNRFCLTVADNGTGYPPAVLAALQGTPQNEQTPHILGLHVVEQIAAAHGGRVVFGQNAPNGAKATVWLPCAEKRPRQCS